MNRTTRTVVLLIALAFAAGSFVATYAWPPETTSKGTSCAMSDDGKPCGMAGECRCLAAWLQLSPEETKNLAKIGEPFAQRRPELEAALFAERHKLANLFESEDATDEQILKQVERVIIANGELERCVAEYLVALRPHLTDAQRARLYSRCAKGVREAGGCRWQNRKLGDKPNCGKTCPMKRGDDLDLTIPSGGCGMGATSRPACHKHCPASSE